MIQISSRTVDGTTNPFCAVRTFVVGAQGVIKNYPYKATFESGSSDGWQAVDWDNGRFVFGTVATNPSGVAYVANPKANDFVVLQSPPFDLSKLRSSILSINVLWSFMSGGASIQFSNDRGRSWHQVIKGFRIFVCLLVRLIVCFFRGRLERQVPVRIGSIRLTSMLSPPS